MHRILKTCTCPETQEVVGSETPRERATAQHPQPGASRVVGMGDGVGRGG